MLYAFLAKTAEPTGPLPNALFHVRYGGINLINAASFPHNQLGLVLVAGLRFRIDECGQPHVVAMEISDPDGDAITEPFEVSFTDEPSQGHPDRGVYRTILIDFPDLDFPRAGDYEIRFKVDGGAATAISLYLDYLPGPASRRQASSGN